VYQTEDKNAVDQTKSPYPDLILILMVYLF